jgi:hypothetical protein
LIPEIREDGMGIEERFVAVPGVSEEGIVDDGSVDVGECDEGSVGAVETGRRGIAPAPAAATPAPTAAAPAPAANPPPDEGSVVVGLVLWLGCFSSSFAARAPAVPAAPAAAAAVTARFFRRSRRNSQMRARKMMIPTTTPTTIPAIAPPLRPESESEFALASVWVASGDVVEDDVVDAVDVEEVEADVDEGDAVSVVHVYEFWNTGPELLLSSSSPPPPEEELSWSIAAHVAEPVVTMEDWPPTCSSILKERLSAYQNHITFQSIEGKHVRVEPATQLQTTCHPLEVIHGQIDQRIVILNRQVPAYSSYTLQP